MINHNKEYCLQRWFGEFDYDTNRRGSVALLHLSFGKPRTGLGGSNKEYGNAVVLDGSGNTLVTGYAYSQDFPHYTGCIQPEQRHDQQQRIRGQDQRTGLGLDDRLYLNTLSSQKTVPTTSSGQAYDIANQLARVNWVPYTWDDNNNLLNDGVNTYTYDYFNRLISVIDPLMSSLHAYDGLGDLLQQTVEGFRSLQFPASKPT